MADTDKTLSGELREAAARVRAAGVAASKFPWRRDGMALATGSGVAAPAYNGVDAEWIALASPLLAEPLAFWLEEEAKMFSRSTYDEPGFTVHAICGGIIGGAVTRCACFDKPLAVARVLNGTAT
jgi:hypothetical protein